MYSETAQVINLLYYQQQKYSSNNPGCWNMFSDNPGTKLFRF